MSEILETRLDLSAVRPRDIDSYYHDKWIFKTHRETLADPTYAGIRRSMAWDDDGNG